MDGFQGREKEVIIFTAVRSNETGKVGFLDKWRRMNVMMTRPRRGLIIIGNRRTLRCDRRWGKWLQWAASNGVIFNERAAGRYVPTFLGDTLVGESEEIEKNDVNKGRRESTAVNNALPQAFLDAQKEVSSEMWDSTNSPISSPKIKQWTEDGDGDDDWDDMYSDDEGGEGGETKSKSSTKVEGEEGEESPKEALEKLSLDD